MTDKELIDYAWKQVKEECEIEGRPMAELHAYYGFFCSGWYARKCYENATSQAEDNSLKSEQ